MEYTEDTARHVEAAVILSNSELIRSDPMGSCYRSVTLRVPEGNSSVFSPGQFAMVDGRFFAIADSRDGEIDFVVRRECFIFEKSTFEVQYPRGSGFSHTGVQDLTCIAAGTGIGAFIKLVSVRKAAGLKTRLWMLGRNVRKCDVVQVFPHLNSDSFECWDTSFWGRLSALEIMHMFDMSKQTDRKILYAGPDSLLREFQALDNCPEIGLNY